MEQVDHLVEVFEELIEGGVGQFFDPGIQDRQKHLGDLFFVDRQRWAGREVAGVFSFDQPSGGPPVAAFGGGSSDIAERLDLDAMFGGVELRGELGIALGSAGDRAMGAPDDASGDAPAAAVGQQGDDLPSFGVVERFGPPAAVWPFGMVGHDDSLVDDLRS